MDAIEIDVTHEGQTKTFAFAKLPVRFGRDPSCELLLMHPFVSRRHGRIESGEGGLVVVDEGSTNGISHAGVRVPASGTLVLGLGGAFAIDGLSVSVRTAEAVTELTAAAPPDATSPGEDTVPIPTRSMETRTSLYADQQIWPGSLDDGLRALDDYRAARTRALDCVRGAIAAVGGDEERAALVRELASAYGELAHDPALREIALENDVLLDDPSAEARGLAEHVEDLANRHALPCGVAPRTDPHTFLRRADQALTLATDSLLELELCSRGGESPDALTVLALGTEVRQLLMGRQSDAGDISSWTRDLVDTVRTRYEARIAAERDRVTAEILAAVSPAATEASVPRSWWSAWSRSGALWRAYKERYAKLADDRRARPRLAERFLERTDLDPCDFVVTDLYEACAWGAQQPVR